MKTPLSSLTKAIHKIVFKWSYPPAKLQKSYRPTVLTAFLLLIFTANVYSADFIFYDSDKRHQYSITKMAAQFTELYGYEIKPYAIVVAATKLSTEYKQQLKYLSKLDAEKWSLIYIQSLVTQATDDNYHTDKNVAVQLLQDNSFNVLIFSPGGTLLKESNHVLNDKEIINIVTQEVSNQ
ncbi:hypothetical protein [Zooshikella harenae]|uniref:DUF4174 domain-containing protein n=1 Tax=Zooshikella harenae TaxID=2827238 RepID=A0ABS5ZFN1_9GAMM|nr:hypothetical protein [Zooshikella harenae]MBU2712578.1 hypothetical protein [Zooshikella harenae]